MINNKINPLDENGISRLLYLEESHLKFPKEEKKAMRQFKKSLIEYYDSLKDPIKLYYMDKMQSAVFRFNKIKENSESDNNPVLVDRTEIYNSKRDSNKFKPMQKYQKQIQNGKKLFEVRKAQRETEEFLLRSYQKENNIEAKRNLQKRLNMFKKLNEQNTKVIKNQLDDQQKSIREKLMERRERSMSRSRSKINPSRKSLSRKKNIMQNKQTSMANLLKDLNSPNNEYYGQLIQQRFEQKLDNYIIKMKQKFQLKFCNLFNQNTNKYHNQYKQTDIHAYTTW